MFTWKDFLSTLIQDAHFCQGTHQIVSMHLLKLFYINSMCLATDTPKRSGIQKKKNALNG